MLKEIKKYWEFFKYLDSKLFNSKQKKQTIKLKKNSEIKIKLK